MPLSLATAEAIVSVLAAGVIDAGFDPEKTALLAISGWRARPYGSVSGGLRWAIFRKVPKGTNWFYTLASATMFAFLSQAVTGVFLAMYYRPNASGGAYESIRHITNEVLLGEFVRGMHKWGSTVMVILIFPAHGQDVLLRRLHVLLRRLQVPARAGWIIGGVLLILTFILP